MSSAGQLELEAVIGFAGNVKNGLILHKDDQRIIFALGSTVVIKTLLKQEQFFLQCGDSNAKVSCMTISKDCKFLATGQQTHAGFPASVWIWNLETRQVVHKLDRYKTKIEDLSFSHNNKYLATLGGDDNNNIIIWNVETGDAICGSPAANDTALAISFSQTDDTKFVSCGKYNFKIWDFDEKNRKIRPTDCKLGQYKRIFNCLTIDSNDDRIFAGTQSGDLLQISLKHSLFQYKGPNKKPFSMGIKCVLLTKKNEIIVGAGDGTVALMSINGLKIIRSIKLEGSITSITLNKLQDHFFVGTNKSNQYLIAIDNFDYELRTSSHHTTINDLCFAKNYSDLFITAGINDIRIWHSKKHNELLRIQLQDPLIKCLCIIVSNDGTCLLSGWSDNKVRAFYPESGKLMYTIHDAADNGVSSICLTKDGKKLITGGNKVIRVWNINIEQNVQTMLCSLKEHQSTITSICLNDKNTKFLTSSADGSCVLWDLIQLTRINAFFSSTNQFSCIYYHPDMSQLITAGTDRQITYWDSTDLSTIRIIEGSENGSITSLSLNNNGTKFASSSNDKLIKLWDYDNGNVEAIGIGHSGKVNKCKISPNNQFIVSIGDEGAIMIWKMPKENDNNNTQNQNENENEIEMEKQKE